MSVAVLTTFLIESTAPDLCLKLTRHARRVLARQKFPPVELPRRRSTNKWEKNDDEIHEHAQIHAEHGAGRAAKR